MSYNVQERIGKQRFFGVNVQCVNPANGVAKCRFSILSILTRDEGDDSDGD